MKYLFIIVSCFFGLSSTGQVIKGTVRDADGELLTGASVYWLDGSHGTTTNENGRFSISTARVRTRMLITSFVGYRTDTLMIDRENEIEIVLAASQVMQEVMVKGLRDGISISSVQAIKTEQINQTELGKAACCDLAGCFETQATVQPQTTNIITNSKELRILGLSGVYNQVLIDGFPMIQGLSYTYGISTIPGTLVDNIYIAKGANSVLQGYESISGQINVETKDPDNTDKLLLNLYANSFGEKHINGNYAFSVGQWKSLIGIHTVLPAVKVDRDNDDFLDLPLLNRQVLFNKWKYGYENEWGWHSEIGLRLVNEQRTGGQSNFNPETDKGSTAVYGQTVQLQQPELWTKTGYRYDDRHHVVLFVSAYHQDQNSHFGTVSYDAQQTNLYANLQHELSYGDHLVKSGLSFRHFDLHEHLGFGNSTLDRTYAGNYDRRESIPGIFTEYTGQFFEGKLTWIAGIRADRHNQFGTYLTPRTLLKYDITPLSTIRANIGKGWRTVNLFSENINLLVSSRDVIFSEALRPEEALNWGVNYTQKFETDNTSGYFSIDYYRTSFQNQIFPDYDTDPRKAIISNFMGTSIGNGLQAEMYIRLHQKYEFRAGYNLLDVYREQGDAKELLPFNPRHKVLSTFSYKPLSGRFHIDLNAHWYGPQRLPNTDANPQVFRRPDFSETYATLSGQFTYNFDQLEAYIGCENIFDFRQQRPIISWEDPFGPYFDTSFAWGPTRGREVYMGIRYRIADEK